MSSRRTAMTKKKQVRKFGEVKRMLNPNDSRLKSNKEKDVENARKVEERKKQRVELAASSIFFQHNSALGPPYRVLVDTNFINFALQNKLELMQGMMDCLYAKGTSARHFAPYLHSHSVHYYVCHL